MNVDERTRREIDEVVWRTLRDAGIVRPPVRPEVLLGHLNLYRDYYDLQDPGFLDKAKHKVQVHGRKLVDIIKKVSLKAVLFHDEDRIVVDSSLSEIRREWPTMHEAAHRILVWHGPYFSYGDTAQTLDPEWHEQLEAEANYGASALMFCGPVFDREAKDSRPGWAAVKELKGRYRKSYTTTLRRYVEHGPQWPMVMVVNTPWWEEKPDDQPTRCRYFVPSSEFAARFANIGPEEVMEKLDANSARHRGGPVADFSLGLRDADGELFEFRAESFFNSYYQQTLFVCVGEMAMRTVVTGHEVGRRD